MAFWLPSNLSILNRAMPLAAAAWLSFVCAALLNVENAYWAAMPVWVISQPTRGLLFGRAIYRIAGSLVGAGLGFWILHLPFPVPLQLCLAAAVIAFGAAACHLIPGVRSYAAIMLAVTVAVVVIPTVLNTEASLHLAIERVICTLIGVVVTTAVMSLWTPPAPRRQFYKSVRQVSIDTLTMAARALSQSPSSSAQDHQLLAAVCDLDAKATSIAASSRDGYLRHRHVISLIASSLDVQAAAQDVAGLVRAGYTLPSGTVEFIEQTAWHLKHGAMPATSGPEFHYTEEVLETVPSSVRRLLDGVRHIVTAEQKLFSLQGNDASESCPPKIDVPRDWLSAGQSALISGSTAAIATNVIYFSGIAVAVPMAMAVCIFSIVLGSLPLPQKIAPKLFAGVCSGVAASIIYRIWIQPFTDDTMSLVISVLPFFIVGALARAHPTTAVAAIDANMCFMLASQAGRPAVIPDIALIEGAAMVMGTALISGGFYLLPRQPHRRALHTVKSIRKDIERLVVRPTRNETWHPMANRKILRLTLHLRQAEKYDNDVWTGLLALINLAHAIITLHQRRATGEPNAIRALSSLYLCEQDPIGTSTALHHLSQQTNDTALKMVLNSACLSILQSERLLAMGGPPMANRQKRF